MKISMVGAGYVGLVSGACFSEFGWDVVCVDKDAEKVAKLRAGIMPIYEPGLEDLVKRNVGAGRLSFSNQLEASVADADAVFIAVGTPSRRDDGQADLTYVYNATEEIAHAIVRNTVIVTKSTVPVGTGREIARRIGELRKDVDVDVVSNPEFLREGSALEDFMRPDRVVVGSESDSARDLVAALYRPLYLRETPIIHSGLETAELIKYASNCFLATKISFINEFADLCEKVGADIQDVARGIGLDARIGSKFLHPGPGYGGSCFPKDTKALLKVAQQVGAPVSIVERVDSVNERRKSAMAEKIIEACGGSVSGKIIAILGLTFKPNTDDMRDSPSLSIIPRLIENGAVIRAFDPVGLEEACRLIDGLTGCRDAYHAMEAADAVVILTEWNEFRALDLERMKALLRTPLMIDLRNIYKLDDMAAAGFRYVSVGRPTVEGMI